MKVLLHLVAATLFVTPCFAQDGGAPPTEPPTVQTPDVQSPEQETPIGEQLGQVQGEAEREVMWRAPTEAEWAMPTLIRWQRSWEDAVALSVKTGKPILVCVNMDGEIASEHYAGVRYRQPEVAALYEPYVTVIASVYRHTARDYDDEGRRVPCPRFGGVTCGEHITLEPIVYERYLDGRRIAPRHIMVELDGSEVYDVFYAFDTASVFQTVYDGVVDRENPVPWVEPEEPSLVERLTSPDAEDQEWVERVFRAGTRAERREILTAAVSAGPDSPLDLLRLAIFGLDVEQARLARAALAQTQDPAAIELITEALRVPMEPAEREPLIAALDRLSALDARAGTLAVVYRGLGAESGAVDVEAWAGSLKGAPASADAYERDTLEERLREKQRAAAAAREDAQANLEAAEATLALAVDPSTLETLPSDPVERKRLHRLMYEDVLAKAGKAADLGAGGWRADAAMAVAHSSLGNARQAAELAAKAVEALPVGADSWSAMAALSIFVDGRRQSISRRQRRGESWPPEWLADMHSAYAVLARHPYGLDAHIADHHDFLRRMGAVGPAAEVLEVGLERFPLSANLHARLRSSLLRDKGVKGLMERYDAILAQPGTGAPRMQFAGYAALVAAEFERRQLRGPEGLDAYTRAIELYEASIALAPEDKGVAHSADHFVAMALAGRARILMDAEQEAEAVAQLLQSFERCPDAASVLDGLNFSAATTAISLWARLKARGQSELEDQLKTALDALDPALLARPGFETEGPNAPVGGGRPPRRR